MKKYLVGLVAACVLMFSNQADAKWTVGGALGTPEIFGVNLSYFPDNNVSLDGQLTLSTVDGGVTGHIPLSRHVEDRHSLLLSGLLGYSHNLVSTFKYHGLHSSLAAGYGYQTRSGWDLRLLAGVTLASSPRDDYTDSSFHGRVVLGHTF